MARLSIRLLGPLQIKLKGRPVSGIESDKVRALLVYLAVAGFGPHRREKLTALLWPDYSEHSGRANLRHALANLRRVLGDCEAEQPFLSVTRQTIRFNPSSDAWLDVAALRALLSGSPPQPLSQARALPDGTQIVSRLAKAVELYRGEFLEGFTLADCPDFDEWAMFQQEQLHRQVMDSLRLLADWYEDRSDWQQALKYAWRQVALDPWQESGHRQIMRLLSFSGQRSAALIQYRTCCRVLDEQLGVEPEAKTVQLYERIRDCALQAAETGHAGLQLLETPARPPAFLSADGKQRLASEVFVARERELGRLNRQLDKAIAGQTQVVFVTGGPGRGKTALLGEFARQAMLDHPDLLVAMGSCSAAAGTGDPFVPFRDVLSMLSGDVEDRWKAGTISRDHAQRLWRALPAVAQTLRGRGSQLFPVLLSGAGLVSRARAAVAATTPWLRELAESVDRQEYLAEDTDRSRLFQQVTQVLHELAEVHPLLLILDDLQWIDSASACLLFHLGLRLGASRILVAGAYRPEEVLPSPGAGPAVEPASGDRGRHPLLKVLAEFKRRFGDVFLDLAQVSEPEARRFVDLYLDSEPSSLGEGFRDLLFRRAGGHPLFTIEVLRLMQERGDLLLNEDGLWIEGLALDWQTLPARVEGVIEERIGRLDDDLRHLLAVASAEGQEFTATVVAEVERMDELELLHRLSGELEKRYRLVREVGVETVGSHRLVRYRFAHALIQQYLYRQLSEGERAALHRQIAGILEDLYGSSQGEIAGQAAHHRNFRPSLDVKRYGAPS